MSRFSYLLLLVLLGISCYAQNISVSSFKLDEMDITANTAGTIVLDQNGEKCALIKIETTQTGFSFDVGILGVQKTVQKAGEIWVYVPAGTKKITVQHPQIGVLRDYVFPTSIQKGKTYTMVITSAKVRTIVEEDDGMSYFALSVSPSNAIVMVDDQPQSLDADGGVIMRLARGEHRYVVKAAGYLEKSSTFTLGNERKSINVLLESTMATLVASCPTKGANIYINDVLKGTGSWKGQLMPGNYLVEARLEGYYAQKSSIQLAEKEQKNISLPELIARTGSIDVAYKPVDADVYIDGKYKGKSPDTFKNIIIGNHKVTIQKDGYSSMIENITVMEGETTKVSGSLDKYVASPISSDNDGSAGDNKVFDVVEQMPSFPGGQSALLQYISSNLKYPAVAEENGIQGRVTVQFVVEKDGRLTNVKTMKSVDPSLDKEAERIVISMPKWNPGKQNGSAVRVKYFVPVAFRLN